MDDKFTIFNELAPLYIKGQLTAAQLDVFMQLLQDEALLMQMGVFMDRDLNEKRITGLSNPVQLGNLYESILSKANIQRAGTSKKTPVLKANWFRYAAAAVFVLVIGLGVYYFNKQSSAIIGGTGETRRTGVDIAPGTNRAILTIDDNQNIDLAINKTGININNTISYNDGEKIAEAGQLLQLTTPRGGQYQAVLPDGSRVWLNAASSIKFPSTFNNKERRVEVTGEVYFEIAKDAAKPFKVSGGGQEIEVLGTSFNINIYNDEPIQKTTLITGSIKITHNNQTAILQPGQQANISILSILPIRLILVQTDEAISWTSGKFIFRKVPIETIMRQLARWYDLDIVYEKKTDNLFTTTIPKEAPLSQVLKILEMTDDVHFTVEGRRVLVKP